jgi:hypothetical protein
MEETRINYYLGKNLIEKKIDIKTAKFTTINDYDNEKLYKILGRKIDFWENYYIQLKSAF